MNHGVAAAAARLGRDQADQAGQEGPHRGEEHDDERAQDEAPGLADDLFAMRAERGVAGDAFEQERLRVFEAREEAPRRCSPAPNPTSGGVQQGSSQDAEIERRRDRAQRRRKRRRPAGALVRPALIRHWPIFGRGGRRAHADKREPGGRRTIRLPRIRVASPSVCRVMPRCCAASVRLP